MELKRISRDAVGRALELAERYRLLNEPFQAASICRDALEADPGNERARRMLLLALTEEFGRKGGATVQEVEKLADAMETPYERAYYRGLACERWGRAQLDGSGHPAMAGDWIRRAMDHYEKAEALRDPGNDDPLLRWNACARLIQADARLSEREEAPSFGD